MIRTIAAAILVVIVFNMTAIMVMAQLPPPLGLAWLLLLTAAFYAWSIRPGKRRRERVAALRLRRPAAPPRTILLSAGATLLVMLGVGSFVAVIAPDIEASDIPGWYELLLPYRESVIGRAALAVLIAGAIPLVEEFSFRGRILRRLERRYGVRAAIVVSAVLFMMMHIGGPHWSILGISLALGILCGLAVQVFRSIWVAVLFHCLWNGMLLTAEAAFPETAAGPELGTAEMLVSGVLLAAAGVLGWRQVLAGGRGVRPRREPLPGG